VLSFFSFFIGSIFFANLQKKKNYTNHQHKPYFLLAKNIQKTMIFAEPIKQYVYLYQLFICVCSQNNGMHFTVFCKNNQFAIR